MEEFTNSEKKDRFAYLFKSVSQEYPEPVETTIEGEIPKWLTGNLIRNGPGLFEVGESSYNHWFDGLALLHRFSFQDGKVTYQNRFLRSDAYKKATKYNRIVLSEFGTFGIPDPCKCILERFMTHFLPLNITDNDLINIFNVGDNVYVCTETCFARQINQDDLTSCQEKVNTFTSLGVLTACAHPHVDRDGTTYNMGSTYFTGANYNIVKFNSAEKNPTRGAKIVASLPARKCLKPSYFHSFGITENYFVFLEQPLVIDVISLASSSIRQQPVCKSLVYDPHEYSYFYVINKKTGEATRTTYKTNGFFAMHQINAYEKDGHIVFDWCCYEDAGMIDKFYLDYLRKSDGKHEFAAATAKRYVLPLNIDKHTTVGKNLVKIKDTTATAVYQKDGSLFLQPQILTTAAADLPTFNYEHYNQRDYNYFYAASAVGLGDFINRIIKVDVKTGDFKSWHEADCYPSEPVFVGKPGSTIEDEGVVLSAVINAKKKSAFLLVLDAANFSEIGRTLIPDTVECALTFHGRFFQK